MLPIEPVVLRWISTWNDVPLTLLPDVTFARYSIPDDDDASRSTETMITLPPEPPEGATTFVLLIVTVSVPRIPPEVFLHCTIPAIVETLVDAEPWLAVSSVLGKPAFVLRASVPTLVNLPVDAVVAPMDELLIVRPVSELVNDGAEPPPPFEISTLFALPAAVVASAVPPLS